MILDEFGIGYAPFRDGLYVQIPCLYATGMAANALAGAPRMEQIFGGMFLSGRKAALEILEKRGLWDGRFNHCRPRHRGELV